MKLKTVRGCGKLGIMFDKDDSEGSRVSTKFVEQLINNIVRRCVNYYKLTKDHAFYYSERQLNSMVCPAIADITPGYIMEQSVERKPRGKGKYSGRADYWVACGTFAFVIELKHEYLAYNHVNPPRASIFDSFDDALKQLSAIKKEECRNLAYGSCNLIKIAFETIVFYEGSKNPKKRNSWKTKKFEQIFEKMLKHTGLRKIANVFALWVLNKSLVEPYPFGEPMGYFEVYPAVAFVAHISEAQT
jgi:hypothetical protein